MLTVIITSLLFSTGEGLRLKPFPEPENTLERYGFISKTSDKTLTLYGPLDIPAQPQKRSKRQALELASPESEADRNVVVTPFSSLFEYEATVTGPLLFVPRPEGRAPPSFS